MIYKRRSFRRGYLKLEGITEKECLDSLANSELGILIQQFTFDKEFSLRGYLQLIEGGNQIEALDMRDEIILALQKHCWEEYLFYDHLVGWCQKELVRRKS